MKKHLIPLFLICAMILSGCGKKKLSSEPAAAESTAAEPVIITQSPLKYNTIDNVAEDIRTGLKKDIMAAAEACSDVYNAADKGSAFNVVLSSSTVSQMVMNIAALGFPAIDYNRTMDLQSADSLIDFGYKLYSSEDLVGTYYEVYPDGHISAYRLCRSFGDWSLITVTVRWSSEGKPGISGEGQYVIGDVQFTSKGWLIYKRDNTSFDTNQQANSEAYVFLRLKPYDAKMRDFCKRYVEPIGYLENNLFTTDWTEAYFTPIDYNSLYASLFACYNGTDPLTSYNVLYYYQRLEDTSIFLVPEQTFEATVMRYFNIDSYTLKSISDYSSALGAYLFLGYDKDYYNVTPRTPYPEVTDYWYNADGTLTLRVDAVNEWYGTDCAFTHELTVREGDNGSFKYVSNRLIKRESNILPDCKLSILLDVERTKTDY